MPVAQVQDGVCGVGILYTGTRVLYKTEQKHAVTFWRYSCLSTDGPFSDNQFHQPTDFTGDFQMTHQSALGAAMVCFLGIGVGGGL